MYRWILLLIVAPYVVLATSDVVDISIKDDSFEGSVFTIPQGSEYNTSFIIENTTTKILEATIDVVGEETDSLVGGTIFFTDDLDEEYLEQLQNNNNDVALFCGAKHDDTNVQAWCEGVESIPVKILANSFVEVPIVMHIADDAKDHVAEIIVKKNEGSEIIGHKEIVYKVPDKNITSIELKEFLLQKTSNIFDIVGWTKAGLRDQFNSNIVVENTGTEQIEYEYCVNIESLWIDETVDFCNDSIIESADIKNHNDIISVPRFGKVRIIGSIKYVDKADEIRAQESAPIEFIIWPVQLFFILVAGICFYFICVLLYKYLIKNMFGFKKIKKEKNKYTGTYVVKDADNIISIAQKHDMPWKELAKINDIESPYILISGETISVPSEEGDSDVEKTSEGDVSQEEVNETKIDSDVVQNGESMDMGVGSKPGSVAMAAQQSKKQQSAQEKTPAQQDVTKNVKMDEGEKKKKIIYASPKNMLAKPSSEPTTRAIDIEWMREDETMYSEEVQIQRKKMNVRFIMVSTLIIIVVGLATWWGITWFLNQNDEDVVSVDTLIEESADNVQQETTEHNDEEIIESAESEESQDIEQTEVVDGEQLAVEEVESKSKENIIVQVLNAGGKVGAAGAVTNTFEQEGYKVLAAENAENDYEGVVIYYDPSVKSESDSVSSIVSEDYGTQKQEESKGVTDKYNADFVVVLGS